MAEPIKYLKFHKALLVHTLKEILDGGTILTDCGLKRTDDDLGHSSTLRPANLGQLCFVCNERSTVRTSPPVPYAARKRPRRPGRS